MSSILLVRHGQASFGTANYDRLSALGHRQARSLGGVLAAREVTPGLVVAGRLKRQQATAAALVYSAGWDRGVVTDGAWDEFDHAHFLVPDLDPPGTSDARAFQRVLEKGMRGWVAGRTVLPQAETFEDFATRSREALHRLIDAAGRGPAIAVTSAGVISWLAALLLDGGPEQWIRLNRVCVNTAITKVVVGRSGISLVAFNDHSHLDHSMVTYR